VLKKEEPKGDREKQYIVMRTNTRKTHVYFLLYCNEIISFYPPKRIYIIYNNFFITINIWKKSHIKSPRKKRKPLAVQSFKGNKVAQNDTKYDGP